MVGEPHPVGKGGGFLGSRAIFISAVHLVELCWSKLKSGATLNLPAGYFFFSVGGGHLQETHITFIISHLELDCA